MTPQTLRPASDTFRAAAALLSQLRELVGSMDDGAYTSPSEAMFGACVGSHVRHTLDHFRAALGGVGGDVIDYDRRERDTDIEKSTRSAAREIEGLIGAIEGLSAEDAGRDVTIRVMLTPEGDCADLTTTLARELAFASHHGVHHNAMIRTICREHGFETPAHFGKAPSTIDHERRA